MSPLLHTISLVSAAASGSLFSAIWEGGVLAACVALCLRMMPGLSAAARSVIWMTVFMLLALLQVMPSMAAHWSFGLRGGSAGTTFNHPTFYLDPRWSVAIAGVWAALSLWRGIQLMVSAIRLHGLAARAIPVPANAATHALLQGGKASRGVQLCTSVEVDRPSVFGFFRPRILIPPALLTELTALELQHVILHEMEHLRRGDDWTNLMQKLGLVLFPLNPALVWVERRLCAERELACDDRVLHSPGARKGYAACLARLAEYSMLRRSLSLALGAWERQPELVRRIERILRRPNQSMSGRQAAVLTGSLLVSVLTAAIGLAHSPQLVSFAPRAQSTMTTQSISAQDFREMSSQQFGVAPTLVKAVMPERQIRAQYVSNHQSTKTTKQNLRRSQVTPSHKAWVVLTDWQDTEPPAHLMITVFQDHQASYAAVPIANGWLIVQI